MRAATRRELASTIRAYLVEPDFHQDSDLEYVEELIERAVDPERPATREEILEVVDELNRRFP